MRQALSILLVTALVAPLLVLTGCGCKDSCAPTYDKCGTEYHKEGAK